jgi:hypothetical protein
LTNFENFGIDVKSPILQVALVPHSASHVVMSTTPGSDLGIRLLDFSQNKFTTTLRRSASPPTDDVSMPNQGGYYLALEFSTVASNVLYAAGMGSNDKSVVDVYECNV